MYEGLTNIEVLDKAIRQLLETNEERESFEVRNGVTFVDYEVFLGDHVEAIDKRSLEEKRRHDAMDTFARGLVYRMRNRRLSQPVAYNRKDVVREINAVLRGIVAEFGRVPLGLPNSVTDYLVENRMIAKYLKDSCNVREKDQGLLDTPTEKLGISNRYITSLKEAGFKTIREIIALNFDDLQSQVMGLGYTGGNQIRAEVERLGLEFKPLVKNLSWSRLKGARTRNLEEAPVENKEEATNA